MVTSFGGKNCWVFKDWFEINFRLNNNVPKEYGFNNIQVVPILCFEGPNASGKTCALKALSFISDFCRNSFSYSPESPVPYDTYFHNTDDSFFYVSFFLLNDLTTEYTYEVCFSKKKVKTEKLISKRAKIKETLISRTGTRIIKNNFTSSKNLVINLRENSSFISTFYQYGVKEILPFINFFLSIHSNITYLGRNEFNHLEDPAGYYHEHPDMLVRVVDELKRLDTGIKDIKIHEYTYKDGKKGLYSVVVNETEEGDKELPHYTMSTGTKALYSELNDMLMVLEKGGVMLFDELDCHLHSSLVPILIGYFLSPEKNKNNAQLVFTSHDSSLLDEAKKYRTYIFEKNKGESICYRIDELPSRLISRNERSLESVYKTGVLGGLPNV